jgi:hypothetical protein
VEAQWLELEAVYLEEDRIQWQLQKTIAKNNLKKTEID